MYIICRQFSFHEIGVLDLPAFIDYILGETGFEKLTYIGFSQGTTALLVLTSMRPEYNEKIVEANLLAPVAFLKGTDSLLCNIMAYFYSPLKKVLEIFRVYKFTMNSQYLSKIVEVACKQVVNPQDGSCKFVLSFVSSKSLNFVGILKKNLQFTNNGLNSRQFQLHNFRLLCHTFFHKHQRVCLCDR